MWLWMRKLPLFDRVHQIIEVRDQIFRVHSSSNSGGPQTSVPGEINFSNGVSFDYTKLLTKSSEIKETTRDFNWNFNLGWLTNVSVPEINSKNRSTCVQSFQTKQKSICQSQFPIFPHKLKVPITKNLTLINFTIILSQMLCQIFHSEILKILNSSVYMKKLLS